MSANIRFVTTNAADAATLTSDVTTNLLLRSQEFDHASWGGTATHTANSTSAPDGTMTADTITDGSAVATQSKTQSVAIANDSATYCASVMLPMVAGAAPYFLLKLSFTGGGIPKSQGIVWNPQTGVFQPVGFDGIMVVEAVNSGVAISGVVWYQVGVYMNNNSTGNVTATLELAPAYSASGAGSPATANVATTGSSAAWGAMLVKNTDRFSGYIPTTSAAVAGGDFVTTLPVTNLQLEGRGRVGRTANAYGNKIINGDLGVTTVCTALILYAHNLSSSARFRIQCWAGANQTGSLLYDSDLTGGPWPAAASGLRYFAAWTLPGAMRSFRVTIFEDVTALGSYIQIKRLLIGAYFEPSVNVAMGLSLAWNDSSVQRRTQGGSVRTELRALYRTLSGSLDTLTEAERVTWLAELASPGLRKEIFVSAFPGLASTKERDFSMLGKFTRLPPIEVVQATTYSGGFEIEEV